MHSQDQYKFVYDTLEEHIKCGKTWFPVAELSERLKAKARKDPATKMNEYQREYAQICKQTPRQVWRHPNRNQHLLHRIWLIRFCLSNICFFSDFILHARRFTIGDCAGGHRADNRDKNRDVLCVPRESTESANLFNHSVSDSKLIRNLWFFSRFSLFAADNFRPYLTSFQGNAFTDYINAVFVDVSILSTRDSIRLDDSAKFAIILKSSYAACESRMWLHSSGAWNIRLFNEIA